MTEREEYPSKTHKITTGCGSMYVTLLYKDKERSIIHEVKVAYGKAGGCSDTQLESKVAFINALITNTSHSIAIKTLTKACGHHCHVGDTCHDLLIRLVIEELMKLKI